MGVEHNNGIDNSLFDKNKQLKFLDGFTRIEITLENGISFHAYHSYTRWTFMPGYFIATIREAYDPTDEYESLEDVPDKLLENMDYDPQFYSLRINSTPVIADYNGTLIIPDGYRKQLKGLSGEYRITRADEY